MNLLPTKIFENKKLSYLLLIVLPVLDYFKSAFYGFSSMDEQWLIVRDSEFIGKWSSLLTVFNDSIQGIYYRPLLWISFIIDSKMGGIQPFYFHVTNIFIHVLAVVFVFRLLLLLQNDIKISFLLALIFALHPLMLNAVAWVPGRNDSLLCIFVVLSLSWFIKYLREQKTFQLLLHFLFFTCAFLTKESSVLLPLLYMVVYFTYSKFTSRFFILLMVWIFISIAWFVIRNSIITYYPLGNGNYLLSIKNTILGFIGFAGKAFFPIQQSIAPTIHNSSIVAGLMTFAVLAFLYFKIGVENKKTALMGLFMYFILLLVPVWFGSNNPLGIQDEHRSYTPLVGLLIFVSQVNFKSHQHIYANALVIIILLFGVKTFYRMDVYKNEVNYINEGVKDCPENFIFHFQKADQLCAQKKFGEAIPFYNKAIELRPDRAQLYNNRANAFTAIGDKEASAQDFTKALQLSDYKAEVYMSRMLNYRYFGEIEKCVEDLNAIQSKYPGFISPDLNKKIMDEWTDYRIQQITKMITEQPFNAGLYVNRARLYMDKNMGSKALEDLERAKEMEPGNIALKNYFYQFHQLFPNN